MPGVYEVRNRGGEQGWGGLALPFPPTDGPLVLDPYADCNKVDMSVTASGDAATYGHAGVWTWGISDCSAVIIAEYVGGAWRHFFFHHIAGSVVTPTITGQAQAALAPAAPANLYAVVAQYYGGSAFYQADNLFDALHIPQNNRSYYKSGYSGMRFGFRFQYGRFGEVDPWTG